MSTLTIARWMLIGFVAINVVTFAVALVTYETGTGIMLVGPAWALSLVSIMGMVVMALVCLLLQAPRLFDRKKQARHGR